MKQKNRILASCALVIVFTLGLGGCGPQSSADATASVAPLSEADKAINEYEKVANELVRVGKKHVEGDASVTMRLIELRHDFRDSSAKVQRAAANMTPQQQQRVAGIASKADPYLLH